MKNRWTYLAPAIGLIVGITVAIVGATWFPEAGYLWVALFGGLVGASELVSRYRDAPERALQSIPASIYIIFNVIASIAALRLIVIFDWLRPAQATPPLSADAYLQRMTTIRVLTAGFSAMAFFRSSLFLTRVGNQDVQVGPVTFLQIVLAAADRAVDRIRGRSRADIAQQCMAGVNFDKALVSLPVFCLALMQNLSSDDQKLLATDVAVLRDDKADPQTKAMTLGLKLMNAVGEGVLTTAVEALAPLIKDAVLLRIEPEAAVSVEVGKDQRLTAKALDVAGNVIARKGIVWSSSDLTVATVDALGQVRGVTAGGAVITATVDGTVRSTKPITVT